MKILWLTETPSKYKPDKYGYNGRGWIESLQSLLEKSGRVDKLGIAFPHWTDSEKHIEKQTIYYPIKRKMPGNIISWIRSNWKANIEQKDEIDALEVIVKDFDPDIIHIFGTESWLCHIIKKTNKTCIVHMQGLLQPCLNAYNPVGISNFDLINYNWLYFIKGISIWHYKRIFEKKASREYGFFKDITYLMGRTEWDKNIAGLLAPTAQYYHVDEVLRDKFYTTTPWKYEKRARIIITSTISDALYKGIDLVIKTASILKKEKLDFEWRIIGVQSNSNSIQLLKKHFKIEYSELNINLLGIKDSVEIIALLSETLFYVHTSYIDNSPNSLCEAQLMGVPIIATNVGGVSSLIDNGKDGFLVPANDPYYMASKIVHLSTEASYLTIISENARERAQKRHSKENILNQLLDIYQHLSIDNLKIDKKALVQNKL